MAPGTVAAFTPLSGHARRRSSCSVKNSRRPARRRPAARVERVELLVLGRPDEREEIAADAGVVLRRHVEHGARGDGRVDGVAALLQNLEAGLRGERIARRDDAVSGEHFGATLRQPALRARAGDRLDARRRLRLVGDGRPNGFGDWAMAAAPAAMAKSAAIRLARVRFMGGLREDSNADKLTGSTGSAGFTAGSELVSGG